MNKLARVIGIGSRYGDDRAGWLVASRLAMLPDLEAEVIALLNPADLLDHLDCEKLIVVDAAQSDSPEFAVLRFCWPDDAIEFSDSCSSHGVGLAYALGMAEQMQTLPREVVVFAMACGAPNSARAEGVPSESLLLQVYEAARRIRVEIAQEEGRAGA